MKKRPWSDRPKKVPRKHFIWIASGKERSAQVKIHSVLTGDLRKKKRRQKKFKSSVHPVITGSAKSRNDLQLEKTPVINPVSSSFRFFPARWIRI
jgi:hypothetical protein